MWGVVTREWVWFGAIGSSLVNLTFDPQGEGRGLVNTPHKFCASYTMVKPELKGFTVIVAEEVDLSIMDKIMCPLSWSVIIETAIVVRVWHIIKMFFV